MKTSSTGVRIPTLRLRIAFGLLGALAGYATIVAVALSEDGLSVTIVKPLLLIFGGMVALTPIVILACEKYLWPVILGVMAPGGSDESR